MAALPGGVSGAPPRMGANSAAMRTAWPNKVETRGRVPGVGRIVKWRKLEADSYNLVKLEHPKRLGEAVKGRPLQIPIQPPRLTEPAQCQRTEPHWRGLRFPSPPSHSRAPAVPQVLHHPQTMEDWRSAFAEEWDAVVMGTGMKECLLSGLLSVAGKKVLHVDRNNYYGGASASLDIQQLFSKFAGSAEPSAL